MEIGEGLTIALFIMAVVFSMLFLLIFSCKIMSFIVTSLEKKAQNKGGQ